jgi:transposase
MNVRYIVDLTQDERASLEALVQGGKHLVRDTKRAQVLLAADAGVADGDIATSVQLGTATVYRTKRRCVELGIDAAVHDRPRSGGERKLSGKEEALLVATACTSPPEGRARWTLDLLAGEIVRLTEHTSLSKATVGRRLAENDLKPWKKKMWCIPKVDAEFVARMEDVLDLYADLPRHDEPVVCFDESPIQLIGEARTPKPVAPGLPAQVDYEYRRNGTANLFVMIDAHKPWRHVKVTDHRSSADFAECMRELVDEHYPDAARIRVVLDNLSTHTPAALYQSFTPSEARRILRQIEFHYVPKHASWLNMVEIEIGVLKSQCLDRRIPEKDILVREIAAWQRARNAGREKIRWMFTVEKARKKMGRAYPTLPPAALSLAA